MKYEINWNSPVQGSQSTTIDALNTFAAREQFDSMYGNIKSLTVVSISPVFVKEDDHESEELYSSSYESSGGGDADDFSTMIGGAALAAGGFIALFGLFTLPTGIVSMVIGGAVGWVGWKVACWLSDRGW